LLKIDLPSLTTTKAKQGGSLMITNLTTLTNVGRPPAGLAAPHAATSWALSTAKKTSDADLTKAIAAGKSVMSSVADPTKRIIVAQDSPSTQPDDDDVMQLMAAAFGGLYESAARINQVCKQVDTRAAPDVKEAAVDAVQSPDPRIDA
jgi:hypothetical protein